MSRYFPSPAECGHHILFGSLPARTYAGESLQLSLVDLPAGGVVDWHNHPNEQMGMVTAGELTFHIGDETRVLSTGDMYLIPSGVLHRVVAHAGPAQALDVFHPVRDEYR